MKDFHNIYEKFYSMANASKAFKKFCTTAYGADFSQDGFSNIDQINLIFKYAPKTKNPHILDVGCGNGKMLKYLQKRLGDHIYGFDFSENAIQNARSNNTENSDFKIGKIGEIDYSPKKFDLIISMDTVYFANDINEFLAQAYKWLKKNGIFFIGYQEGDIMPKTSDSKTTILAQALRKNNLKYDAIYYTKQTYDMLTKKRKVIIDFKCDFAQENLQDWHNIILKQTNSVTMPHSGYIKHNARYIYVARK